MNKDDNKSYCCAENLEWVQKTDRIKKFVESHCRKVHQYNFNDIYIQTWNSVKEAEEKIAIIGSSYAYNKESAETGGFT